jgi:hypothetical protein
MYTFSGSSSRGILVKDRVCRIDLAVDRESAQRLKSDNKSAIANDKRNMYLANEGIHMYMYTCKYVYIYTSVYKYTYRYIHVFMYKVICICTCLFIHIFIYIQVWSSVKERRVQVCPRTTDRKDKKHKVKKEKNF